MCPPSIPRRAAIFRSLKARRTWLEVTQKATSFGKSSASLWIAAICSSAAFTAAGPVMVPLTTMPKKSAPRPPSFIRGRSTCPSCRFDSGLEEIPGGMWPCSAVKSQSGLLTLRVVSMCVSSTKEEKWSFRARSEIASV